MKTILRITAVSGVILAIGGFNDIATLSQTICTFFIGITIATISAILLSFMNNEWYRLTFVDNSGNSKRIRAYNCIGKALAICKYHRLGYTLYSEIKYGNERN